MRRIVWLLLFALAFATVGQAQKYACVNTDYVMQQMPEYNQALNKLNKYVEEWKNELATKQQEVDELREQYEHEAYLLPDNLKQRRQDEIHNKESDLRALQRQRFSTGGDLDQKRAELLKPVQDRVYNTIDRIAREKNYAFVFDRAASAMIIYVGEKYDISNQVLELMGIKPNASASGENASSAGKGGSPAGIGGRNDGRENAKKDNR